MRKFLLITALVAIMAAALFSGVGPAKVERAAAQAGTQCWLYRFTMTNFGGATATANFYWTNQNSTQNYGGGTLTLAPGQSGTMQIVGRIPNSALNGFGFPFIGGTSNGLSFVFDSNSYFGLGNCDTGFDGRLCNWPHHAVYTTGTYIDVYGIWERKGYHVLRVTKDELDAVHGTAGVNTLIKSSPDGLVHVYRLGDSNTIQVVAGVEFVRFTGLPAGNKECGTIDLD